MSSGNQHRSTPEGRYVLKALVEAPGYFQTVMLAADGTTEPSDFRAPPEATITRLEPVDPSDEYEAELRADGAFAVVRKPR